MMKNWQTTAAGVGGILAILASIFSAFGSGHMPDPATITALGGVVINSIGLIRAKDQDVTGGTVPQTLEAAKRLGEPL